jgi:hypothetical protein
MVYAFLVGGALGYGKESIPLAIGILLGAITMKALWEIGIRTNWITNSPSRYVLYVDGLKKRGTVTSRPWVGYLLLSMGTGLAAGGAGYLAGHLLR